jgi:hypothetical protein
MLCRQLVRFALLADLGVLLGLGQLLWLGLWLMLSGSHEFCWRLGCCILVLGCAPILEW